MSIDKWLLIGIIVFTITAFVREWLGMDVIAVATLGLLLVFDLVDLEEAVSGFSNSAVLTVMMMFVLSEGLVQSGLVTKAGYRIADLTGTSQWVASVLLLVLVGTLSGLINNTAAVSVFMPVAIHLARHFGFSPSKILMPLSFVAIFGGTCTLFGTSTNLLVNSLASESFTVFEFLPLGLVLLVVGLLYTVAVPMRYLPSRTILSSLTRQYHLSGFLTELRVPAGSRLEGRTVVEEEVSSRFHLNVLEVIRQGEKISANLRTVRIEAGDILLVRGAVEAIVAFREQFGLLLLTDVKLRDADLSDENTILAELQISPGSGLIGETLKEIDFRRRFGCFVLALNRTGEYIRDKVARVRLRPWDTLLVFGPRSRVESLYEMPGFVPLGERELKLRVSRRWWLPAGTMALVVGLSALQVLPILEAAILGTAVLLVTRSITAQQAYRSIDWTVIFLLAFILPLGTAMQRTGLAADLGQWLGEVGVARGPLVMLSLLYLATALLTSFFSNNATAVLMVPIAVDAAARLGVDAKPLLMAVAYAASASFMTPMGYQTNAMVYGPGNYRFTDYLLYGAPLTFVFWIIATLLIPILWPFG